MNNAKDTLINYYAQRAVEYERIYSKPERQTDLRTLEQILCSVFSGLQVLEIACGTGYWTKVIAKSAATILATDFNSEVLDIARYKEFGDCCVQFTEADAYLLDGIAGRHSAGFHGFWWSHVPVAKIRAFLSVFHTRLTVGSKVVMIDNMYVEGSSTPISRQDSDGNTYQLRRLDDGSEHEILKNFPSDSDLYTSLSGYAKNISVIRLKYFWIAEYNVIEIAEPSSTKGPDKLRL